MKSDRDGGCRWALPRPWAPGELVPLLCGLSHPQCDQHPYWGIIHAVEGVVPPINKLQKVRTYIDLKPPATKTTRCWQGDHKCLSTGSVLPAGPLAAQGHRTGWACSTDPAQPLTPRAPAVTCLVFPVSSFSSDDEELRGSDSKCQAPVAG